MKKVVTVASVAAATAMAVAIPQYLWAQGAEKDCLKFCYFEGKEYSEGMTLPMGGGAVATCQIKVQRQATSWGK
jgi:hypothetical protein